MANKHKWLFVSVRDPIHQKLTDFANEDCKPFLYEYYITKCVLCDEYRLFGETFTIHDTKELAMYVDKDIKEKRYRALECKHIHDLSKLTFKCTCGKEFPTMKSYTRHYNLDHCFQCKNMPSNCTCKTNPPSCYWDLADD